MHGFEPSTALLSQGILVPANVKGTKLLLSGEVAVNLALVQCPDKDNGVVLNDQAESLDVLEKILPEIRVRLLITPPATTSRPGSR